MHIANVSFGQFKITFLVLTIMRQIIAAIILLCIGCNTPKDKTPLTEISDVYQSALSALVIDTQKLASVPFDNPELLQLQFKAARQSFKKIEVFAEFYQHDLVQLMNGPAIQKQNLHDNIRVKLPVTGFQKVEELIFPVTTEDTLLLKEELHRLHGLAKTLQEASRIIRFDEKNILEASKKQLFRIGSLGITGFDSPIAFYSLQEAVLSFQSIKEYLSPLVKRGEGEFSVFEREIESSIKYLSQSNDFEKFSRWDFIRNHLKPTFDALNDWQEAEGISINKWISPVRWNSDFMAEDFFNAAFFAPKYNQNASLKQVALGKALFMDPRLSASGKTACVTCHDPSKSFTDGIPRSITDQGDSLRLRNAPTLINAGYQMAQFYDSRVTYLEEQVKDVIGNPIEMHGSFDEAIQQINDSGAYYSLNQEAFGDSLITGRQLQMALATYIRTLDGLNSKFDQALRGQAILSEMEIEGFNLFMGKAKCATCHFFPLFNGTVPPEFIETESEVLGVPQKYVVKNAIIDPDSGKYPVFRAETHLFAFKTPGVRNSALTAPYMHNGELETLEEVLDFYNRGGGAGIGIELPNQTLPPDSLELSQNEQQKIIMFLQTLNSESKFTPYIAEIE
jgi:cytochrome c peroxidase